MLKSLQRPLRGLLALVFLLTAAPASQATFDSNLYDSTLKKIYRNPGDGDVDDIYKIIRRALEGNPDEGDDFVIALISALKRNHSKIDDSISNKDLNRIRKILRRWVRSHRSENHGNISTPESATTTR